MEKLVTVKRASCALAHWQAAGHLLVATSLLAQLGRALKLVDGVVFVQESRQVISLDCPFDCMELRSICVVQLSFELS